MKATHILFIAATVLLGACAAPEIQEEKKEIPLVVLKPVEVKTFIHKITVQGNVEAEEDILLSSEMGGLITSIKVKEGQMVTKGQVLATLDASVLASNLYELEAQLDQAKYMLSKQEELKKRGLGTEFELTSAATQVKSIEARIKSLKTQTGKSIIKAPFSGTIDKIYADNGEMAGPQVPILRLVNASSVDITADISEKHLAHLKIGTSVEVTFPNYKDTTLNIAITNIGNYIEPTNRTFRITSTIKGNKLLLPNMLAELHVTDMKVDSAIVVPATSILKAHDNSDFIYVARKEKMDTYRVERMSIQLVEKFNGDAYIVPSGSLKEGDFVITEGSRNVTDKEIVRIK